MPMNPNFLCCIGAELKNSTQQTTRMSQIYLYRAFENDTISDMLSAGFFNAAMGIIRQDDLLLLYSPNETTAKYTYARVSSVSSSGVVIEQIDIEAASISVDTTGYSNLSGNNLQEILNNLDTTITTINNAFVKKDGSSIMTGPLKFRAGSFEGAIAGGLGDGISVYKLKADGSIDSEVASLTKTNGFVPGTNNAMDIGRNNLKWKDAYIARVITAVLNNGSDIAVPVTNSADTLALKSEVDLAANSGDQLYATGVWYAKMYSASTVPTGAEYDGRNYADFSQTDSGGNPVIKIYTGASGAWTLTDTITPPANYNGYMTITSKIWDIAEQAGQQGGKVLWSHNQKTFTPYPQIISFEDAALTGTPTAPTLNPSSPSDQIVNKQALENALANSGSGLNVGDTFLTMRTDNELNGAVECDGGTYNTTDFTGAQSIGVLLEAGKIDYVSLSAYSTAISTKGWCDKIGWDGAGNTVFRVPTLNAHIIQTNNIPVVGNDGTIGLTIGSNNYTLASYASGSPNGSLYLYTAGNANPKLTTDSTKSGIIADTSDTAQLRVMIQLATGATDQALETCTGVLADVAALKYDYVVDFQAPTAQNNYTWYRKYKSGWVEQGGSQKFTAAQSVYATVNLPVEMANSDYTLVSQPGYTIITGTNAGQHVASRNGLKTTTTIFIAAYGAGTDDKTDYIDWQVSGMAAQ